MRNTSNLSTNILDLNYGAEEFCWKEGLMSDSILEEVMAQGID